MELHFVDLSVEKCHFNWGMEYKEPIDTLRQSLINLDCDGSNESFDEVISCFYNDFCDLNTQKLLISMKKLLFFIKNKDTDIKNNESFKQYGVISILKSIIENSLSTPLKNRAFEALSYLLDRTDYSEIAEIDSPDFVRTVFFLLDYEHKPAFIFLSLLVCVSENVRDFIFSEFTVDLLISLVSESTHDEDEEKNIGPLLFELLANCCRFDTEEYPKLIDTFIDALGDDVSLDYYCPAVRGLCWIASNGHGAEIYSNINFCSLIPKLICIEDIYFIENFLKTLIQINSQIEFSLIIPCDKLIPLLHCPAKSVFSLACELISEIASNVEGSQEEMVKADLIDVSGEILADGSMNFKEMVVQILDIVSEKTDISLYFDILPATFDILSSSKKNVYMAVMRLFYRFITRCSNEEMVEEMKAEFINNEGIDLLENILENDEDNFLAKELTTIVVEED